MKSRSRILIFTMACAFAAVSAKAEDAPALSAKDLAAKLRVLQQDGSSFVRLKMEVRPPAGAPKFSVQLQIKQRRTAGSTEVIYQVLWPTERAGEAVLLKQSGNGPAKGTIFTPPDKSRELTATQMKDALLGSDLSHADVLENFFAWENQAIVGTEVVNRVTCQILESKPAKGQRAAYATVRSWVDSRRLVPLKIEKYAESGEIVRRIETTDVATDDLRRSVPAKLTVSSPQKGSSTVLDGSKLKHGVALGDHDFTPEGIKNLTPPQAAP